MDYLRYFHSRQGEMIHMLKRLAELESPTSDKKAVDACGAFIADEFKKAGARISRFPQKDIGDPFIVETTSCALKSKDERILVLTHMDTVWPVGKIKSMPFYISGEKVFGPGVLDMKAGIVMVLFALSTLHRLSVVPRRKIAVFMNSAEETGNDAGHALIRQEAAESSLVLCLEPSLPGGALKLERKGRLVMRVETRGKSAHAGHPEKGVNAVEELMAQLGRLKKIRTGETTVNIGQIGGGERPNIVPEKAWAVCDIRFWKNTDKERVRLHFRKMTPVLRGAKVNTIIEGVTPPMEKTKPSAELFAKAVEIGGGLGLALRGGKTGGGSDASIASGMGLPTLDGLGPDGNGIHAENEHLLIPSFIERTALLTELLIKL